MTTVSAFIAQNKRGLRRYRIHVADERQPKRLRLLSTQLIVKPEKSPKMMLAEMVVLTFNRHRERLKEVGAEISPVTSIMIYREQTGQCFRIRNFGPRAPYLK